MTFFLPSFIPCVVHRILRDTSIDSFLPKETRRIIPRAFDQEWPASIYSTMPNASKRWTGKKRADFPLLTMKWKQKSSAFKKQSPTSITHFSNFPKMLVSRGQAIFSPVSWSAGLQVSLPSLFKWTDSFDNMELQLVPSCSPDYDVQLLKDLFSSDRLLGFDSLFSGLPCFIFG